MKKQLPLAPIPRAAALSQSASRFSAGATSAWQSIAGKSPRLAANRVAAPLAPPAAPGSRRVAPELQRAPSLVAPNAEPETIRQVGWREIDRAVGMSTKRKYSLFGIGFGPKVPVFETEKVKLPVYQETDRTRRYYAVVKTEEVGRVKREGLRKVKASKIDSSLATSQAIDCYNRQGDVLFFDTKESAAAYVIKRMSSTYTIVSFTMPEYQEFIPAAEEYSQPYIKNKSHLFHTAKDIPVACIK